MSLSARCQYVAASNGQPEDQRGRFKLWVTESYHELGELGAKVR